VGAYPGKYVKYQGKESELYMDEKGNQVVKDYKRSKLFLRENVISSAYVSEEAIPLIYMVSGETSGSLRSTVNILLTYTNTKDT